MTFAWNVPERFNFARDVVEPRTGPALTFVAADGGRQDLSFAEVNARAAQWTNRLARRGDERDRAPAPRFDDVPGEVEPLRDVPGKRHGSFCQRSR